MYENDLEIKGLDYKKIVKMLEKKKALCPSCERTLKLAGSLYIYQKNDLKVYYVICRKCEYKKERQMNEKQVRIREKVELKLEENTHPYACEIIDDPNIDNILSKAKKPKDNLKINAFPDTTNVWHQADAVFFKENPERKFYARKLYDGELDQTNRDNASLQKDALQKNISFALVHKVAKEQRIYTYTSDLTGHPYEEEAFVAAIFMVRINNLLTADDIYEMYEQIKNNDSILDEFNLSDLKNMP